MFAFHKICIQVTNLIWLFLCVFTNTDCSHAQPPLFTLVDSHLMAKEGSCTEIKCKVTSYVDDFEASWFWMKDALWSEKNHYYFNATVIYSTNQSSHPVSPDFATRVTYNGTSSSRWKYFASSELCSVLICDLKTTDSGNYLFRFLGKDKWATKPGVNLTVKGKNKDQNTERYFESVEEKSHTFIQEQSCFYNRMSQT